MGLFHHMLHYIMEFLKDPYLVLYTFYYPLISNH